MIGIILKFKQANEKDIECIFKLNKELINKYENIHMIDYERVMTWIYQKIKKNISEYTCIFYDNKKVGYFRFYKKDDKMEIDDLYIFPQFQNMGIGTAVIEKCCKETDLKVFLYAFIKNYRAVSLYEKCGFKVIEKIRDSRYIM